MKYDNFKDEWKLITSDKERIKVGKAWLEEDTLDYWRHERMREKVKPFIENNVNAEWLTVGDGRFGLDGQYLIKCGAKNIHCTDLYDELLAIAFNKNLIPNFSSQNAENLKFEDNSFDYVFCKESFHHFPRPFIALYEMFRVSKKGVFLIEPRDTKIQFSIVQFLKKILLNKNTEHNFEHVGNYVYSISERELEKFLLGMHFNKIAFNGVNDAYTKGVEFTKNDILNLDDFFIYFKIKIKILLNNILQKIGLMKSNIIICFLFKEQNPDTILLANLRKNNWLIKDLPKNPFI